MGSKMIFVVGGVYSGSGKGITAASIGFLLQKRGSRVQLIKCDPYLNTNAGTMNPRQHGEVFLCDDGSETDLDLGHYERLAGITMSARNIFTSGTIYQDLLHDVEMGKFLGETIQVVPHVTDKVKERLRDLGKDCDILIAEIGGTVGDMESEAFYDAARQMKQELGDDAMVALVAPIIWNATVKEHKTKPLQNSVKTLLSKGLQPDILLCRTGTEELPETILDKIARMTNVDRGSVFVAPDVRSIYEVPIQFWQSHVDDLIADKFHLRRVGCRIHKYKDLVEHYTNGHDLPRVTVGVVGKYENCDEAYHSLKEALTHAAVACGVKLDVRWVSAEELETTRRSSRLLDGVHGVIVPGGFDVRGVEGKIRAIEYCRTNKVPFLGICLGLQCSVIEFCRNVLGLEGATSEEFNPDAEHKVVHFIPGQESVLKKSGTMRLGAYSCTLSDDTLVWRTYGQKRTISERHRHRYEVNEAYLDRMAGKGFRVSGRHVYDGGQLVEMMELSPDLHPFFVGTQAHPEFRSRLDAPAPLFRGLVEAARVRATDLATAKAN